MPDLPHMDKPLPDAWRRWSPEERGAFMKLLGDRFLGMLDELSRKPARAVALGEIISRSKGT